MMSFNMVKKLVVGGVFCSIVMCKGVITDYFICKKGDLYKEGDPILRSVFILERAYATTKTLIDGEIPLSDLSEEVGYPGRGAGEP